MPDGAEILGLLFQHPLDFDIKIQERTLVQFVGTDDHFAFFCKAVERVSGLLGTLLLVVFGNENNILVAEIRVYIQLL